MVDIWNESPWRYILGVGKEQQIESKNDGGWWNWSEWVTRLESAREKKQTSCFVLMSAHVDILEMIGDGDSKKNVSTKVNFIL